MTTFVYVVHGFGAVEVFDNLKAAESYVRDFASHCTITKTRLRKRNTKWNSK